MRLLLVFAIFVAPVSVPAPAGAADGIGTITIIDFAQREGRGAVGSGCTMPPSDLCTDYATLGIRWALPLMVWSFNAAGAPAGAHAAVQTAFDTWQTERGSPAVRQRYPGDHSTMSFHYAGTTTAYAALDFQNTVSFPSEWTLPSSALAFTACAYHIATGITLDCDIAFNRVDYTWSTAQGSGTQDVENVATHEIGHAIGLGHVVAPEHALLTMYPTAHAGETIKRDLGAGEVLGVRALYPGA